MSMRFGYMLKCTLYNIEGILVIKNRILAITMVALTSTIVNANDLIKSDTDYLAAINTVKTAATYCNTLVVQESNATYGCYEAQRTALKKLVDKFDASNKALGIIDYSRPYTDKSYKACESTYPAELRVFFKAQISQCKLGADVNLAVYAINSIANS